MTRKSASHSRTSSWISTVPAATTAFSASSIRCRRECGKRLYFKDDDSRLSFLQGNYVTLTNMSDHDIDRIIRYHLGPINISFQTTNPELRCKMLHNRFAGNIFPKVQRLYEAGIEMNGQIVLCKGYQRRRRSWSAVFRICQNICRICKVFRLSRSDFRSTATDCTPLEPFTREDAEEVLDHDSQMAEKAV